MMIKTSIDVQWSVVSTVTENRLENTNRFSGPKDLFSSSALLGNKK